MPNGTKPLWLQFAEIRLTDVPYWHKGTKHKGKGAHGSVGGMLRGRAVSGDLWRKASKEEGYVPPFLVCDQLSQVIQFSRGHKDAGNGNSGLANWYRNAGALKPLTNLKQLKPGATVFWIQYESRNTPSEKREWEDVDFPLDESEKGYFGPEKYVIDGVELYPIIYHSGTVIGVKIDTVKGKQIVRGVEFFDTGARTEELEGEEKQFYSGRKIRSVESLLGGQRTKEGKRIAEGDKILYVGYLPEKKAPNWVNQAVEDWQETMIFKEKIEKHEAEVPELLDSSHLGDWPFPERSFGQADMVPQQGAGTRSRPPRTEVGFLGTHKEQEKEFDPYKKKRGRVLFHLKRDATGILTGQKFQLRTPPLGESLHEVITRSRPDPPFADSLLYPQPTPPTHRLTGQKFQLRTPPLGESLHEVIAGRGPAPLSGGPSLPRPAIDLRPYTPGLEAKMYHALPLEAYYEVSAEIDRRFQEQTGIHRKLTNGSEDLLNRRKWFGIRDQVMREREVATRPGSIRPFISNQPASRSRPLRDLDSYLTQLRRIMHEQREVATRPGSIRPFTSNQSASRSRPTWDSDSYLTQLRRIMRKP